ncbi:response regulator [Delftia tsuruhatensis]|uniref:response regulator transcription factor n=1 Tax=Delftia tsuruhatensis TaxID=180282 RepID=UPI0012477432|nr:response regulator [Delftia tsuruhatensis]KAA9152644.1 response regulator [Delftia sp. BR1]MDH0773733.1 response regulator [Delftia tsuruhatensis]MDH1458322.1 response regulator [Delftia tsuruhatensis]MDH1822225.1 response regulator [Delftia tsuruhatensis]WGG11252.1 response regulator [Delftia tsuruhatensis]
MTATTTATSRSSHGNGAHVILVVDDALDSLRMLCDALAAEGYVVLAARDADEALQRFALTVPDGVLLDAVMPGMDGFTLCRRLKDTPAWAHVPVVFMTGLSDTDQIIRGFASGGVDYVVKPLRIPEVLVRLATHVRNARATRQAQEAVDVAGLGVVVLDGQGRVAWRSPQAARWLEEAFADQPFPMEAAGDWLAGAHQPDQAGHQDLALGLADGRQLLARHMGASGLGESMVLLSHEAPQAPATRRLQQVALTPRETEVLSWLSKGKTNRDIADILGMSPRTVNKHLEHIFEKLGVETRTAAAAVAGQLLQAGSP